MQFFRFLGPKALFSDVMASKNLFDDVIGTLVTMATVTMGKDRDCAGLTSYKVSSHYHLPFLS